MLKRGFSFVLARCGLVEALLNILWRLDKIQASLSCVKVLHDFCGVEQHRVQAGVGGVAEVVVTHIR